MKVESLNTSGSHLVLGRAPVVERSSEGTPAPKTLGESPPIVLDLKDIGRFAAMFSPTGVLSRLRKRLNYLKNKKCRIVPAKGHNACVDDQDTVYIGVGLLEEYENDPETLAGILAHEWGHSCALKPIQDVHFDWKYFSPQEAGFKAMSVNVSDIAAMGGRPLWALVNLAFPRLTSSATIRDFYNGLNRAAKLYGIHVVGGNLSRAGQFSCTISLYGEVPRKNCKFRGGAKPGDFIYVTGLLGLSALGLSLLKKNARDRSLFAQSHKTPKARLKEGLFLGKRPEVTSMIDLSDGLLADLSHILKESRVGAQIFWESFPRNSQWEMQVRKTGLSPQQLALTGGEDYQLLFTVSRIGESGFLRKAKRPRFPFFKIGYITSSRSLKIISKDEKEWNFQGRGFDHFCKK